MVFLVIFSINLALIWVYWQKYGGVIADRFIHPSKCFIVMCIWMPSSDYIYFMIPKPSDIGAGMWQHFLAGKNMAVLRRPQCRNSTTQKLFEYTMDCPCVFVKFVVSYNCQNQELSMKSSILSRTGLNIWLSSRNEFSRYEQVWDRYSLCRYYRRSKSS